MRALVMSFLFLGLAGSAACHRSDGTQPKAAVQAAIEDHLRQQPNVVFQNMIVEVGDVTFHGDIAEAQVKVRSRQTPNLAVGMLYKLRRAGKGWQVESTSTMTMPGTTPHGNSAAPTPSATGNPSDIGPQPSH